MERDGTMVNSCFLHAYGCNAIMYRTGIYTYVTYRCQTNLKYLGGGKYAKKKKKNYFLTVESVNS